MSQTTIKGTQVYDRSIDPLNDLTLPTGSNSASLVLLGDGTWGTPSTSSYAVSASYAPGSPSVSASYANSSSWADNVISSSYALSASYAANGGGAAGAYIITGSLLLTGSVNDWNPVGLDSANVLYVASMSQSFGINGLVSQSSNRKITLINTGSSFIYIASDHPSSSAWNRIQYTEDIILSPRQSVGLVYDTTIQKWQVENYSPAVGYKVVSAVITPGSVTAGDYANVTFTTANGGAITNSTSMAAYIGAPSWRIATGTTSISGGASISANKGNSALGYIGWTHMSSEFTISIQTLSDASNAYTIEAGLHQDAIGTTINNYNSCGIKYTHISASGNWFGFNSGNTGNGLEVDLGVPVDINKVYTLRTEIDATNSELRFYINGEMKGIIKSAKNSNTIIDNTIVGAGIRLVKRAGSTNRFIYVSQILTRVGLTL